MKTAVSELLLHKRITVIGHDYKNNSLRMILENHKSIIFYDCALIFDLGIIGHIISFVSFSGTLGMALELKRIGENPDDYNYILLSRDIEDTKNKNEILISYKDLEIESGDTISAANNVTKSNKTVRIFKIDVDNQQDS
jgi:hypothetical protein